MSLFSRVLEQRITSFQQVWGSDSDNEASPFRYDRIISRKEILGLSAVFACVRLLADTVATLPFAAYAGSDERGPRVLSDPQPDWIDRPVPRDPSITKVVHFQQVVSSLLLEGNSFTLVSPDVFRPQELRVLDPRSVEITRQRDSTLIYRVRDFNGGVTGEFDWTQMVHIPLIRLPGELRGVSPLEAEKRLFSGALATEELGERFARNGLWLSAMVEMPPGATLTEEQANDLRDKIERRYNGSRNAGAVGVLTGGATLKQLSVTPEQAQFLQTKQYDDERIFRIYRCPPAMVGMTVAGAVSHGSSDMQAVSFEKHTVRPLVEVIEEQYEILVGSDGYVKFNTKGLLRGDPKAQADLYHLGLVDKWLKVDEVRGYEDLDPLGGTDGGLLQTPNNNAPGGSPPVDTTPRSLVVNIPSDAFHADVHVPATPVTIAKGAVQVTSPITVEAAPTPDVHVNVPEQRAVRKTFRRDAKGQIDEVTETPVGE